MNDEDGSIESRKTMRGRGRGKAKKATKKAVRKASTSKAKTSRARLSHRIEDTDSDEEVVAQSDVIEESVEEELDVEESISADKQVIENKFKNTVETNDGPHPSSTISSPTSFKDDQEPKLPATLAFVSSVKNNVPLHNNQPLSWNHKVNLIGFKCPNPRIHLCGKCGNPILVYGRLLPCKHIFCHDCAKTFLQYCPKCNDKVVRIEKNRIGSVYVCIYDACQRTYLSQRDLQAHIAHRHLRSQQNATNSPNTSFNAGSNLTSPPGLSSTLSSVAAQFSHKPLKTQLPNTFGSNFSASLISSAKPNPLSVPANEDLLTTDLNQLHHNQIKIPIMNKNILSQSLISPSVSKRGWSGDIALTNSSLYQSSPIYDKSSVNSITQRTSSNPSWKVSVRGDNLNQRFHS